MKKKIISTLLCTAMLATMVAGCGVEKSDGGSDTEGSASSVAEMKGTSDNEINILIYAQDHEKAVYQELIDKFTKEHADEISTVNFEVTTQDEYATKMTAAMTAGELPDIFYVGPEAVRSSGKTPVKKRRFVPVNSICSGSNIINDGMFLITAFDTGDHDILWV